MRTLTNVAHQDSSASEDAISLPETFGGAGAGGSAISFDPAHSKPLKISRSINYYDAREDLLGFFCVAAEKAGFTELRRSIESHRIFKKSNRMISIIPPNEIGYGCPIPPDNVGIFVSYYQNDLFVNFIDSFRSDQECEIMQIFLPLKINRSHIGMVEVNLRKERDQIIYDVFYLDPAQYIDYEGRKRGLDPLRQLMQKNGLILTEIFKDFKERPLQNDSVSCGPISGWYMVQRIFGSGKIKDVEKDLTNISRIRNYVRVNLSELIDSFSSVIALEDASEPKVEVVEDEYSSAVITTLKTDPKKLLGVNERGDFELLNNDEGVTYFPTFALPLKNQQIEDAFSLGRVGYYYDILRRNGIYSDANQYSDAKLLLTILFDKEIKYLSFTKKCIEFLSGIIKSLSESAGYDEFLEKIETIKERDYECREFLLSVIDKTMITGTSTSFQSFEQLRRLIKKHITENKRKYLDDIKLFYPDDPINDYVCIESKPKDSSETRFIFSDRNDNKSDFSVLSANKDDASRQAKLFDCRVKEVLNKLTASSGTGSVEVVCIMLVAIKNGGISSVRDDSALKEGFLKVFNYFSSNIPGFIAPKNMDEFVSKAKKFSKSFQTEMGKKQEDDGLNGFYTGNRSDGAKLVPLRLKRTSLQHILEFSEFNKDLICGAKDALLSKSRDAAANSGLSEPEPEPGKSPSPLDSDRKKSWSSRIFSALKGKS